MATGVHALAPSINKMLSIMKMDFDASRCTVPPGRKLGEIYFTTREMEVLQFSARDKTAREIAGILNLLVRTVEQYLENIKCKMGVSSKSEMIDKAISELNINL
jgi:DNA-binding NarL/FixJ family response regulator